MAQFIFNDTTELYRCKGKVIDTGTFVNDKSPFGKYLNEHCAIVENQSSENKKHHVEKKFYNWMKCTFKYMMKIFYLEFGNPPNLTSWFKNEAKFSKLHVMDIDEVLKNSVVSYTTCFSLRITKDKQSFWKWIFLAYLLPTIVIWKVTTKIQMIHIASFLVVGGFAMLFIGISFYKTWKFNQTVYKLRRSIHHYLSTSNQLKTALSNTIHEIKLVEVACRGFPVGNTLPPIARLEANNYKENENLKCSNLHSLLLREVVRNTHTQFSYVIKDIMKCLDFQDDLVVIHQVRDIKTTIDTTIKPNIEPSLLLLSLISQQKSLSDTMEILIPEIVFSLAQKYSDFPFLLNDHMSKVLSILIQTNERIEKLHQMLLKSKTLGKLASPIVNKPSIIKTEKNPTTINNHFVTSIEEMRLNMEMYQGLLYSIQQDVLLENDGRMVKEQLQILQKGLTNTKLRMLELWEFMEKDMDRLLSEKDSKAPLHQNQDILLPCDNPSGMDTTFSPNNNESLNQNREEVTSEDSMTKVFCGLSQPRYCEEVLLNDDESGSVDSKALGKVFGELRTRQQPKEQLCCKLEDDSTEKPIIITEKPTIITEKPIIITEKPIIITEKKGCVDNERNTTNCIEEMEDHDDNNPMKKIKASSFIEDNISSVEILKELEKWDEYDDDKSCQVNHSINRTQLQCELLRSLSQHKKTFVLNEKEHTYSEEDTYSMD